MLARLLFLVLILFWFELGVFLLMVPWSMLWKYNYFVYRWPELGPWLNNHYLRGGISGLGLVDIGMAVWYATRFRQTLAYFRKLTQGTANATTEPSQ